MAGLGERNPRDPDSGAGGKHVKPNHVNTGLGRAEGRHMVRGKGRREQRGSGGSTDNRRGRR